MFSAASRYPLVTIVLLWVLFVVLPIGNRGLWSPDEPRYLQVAWEMSESGSFLVPMMNNEVYAEKPPLFFWLTIGMSKLVDFETASRWVSALMSLGIILATYTLALMTGDRKTGLVAALMLATSGLFSLLMSTGNIDTTLTFFTTASLLCYVLWERERGKLYLVLAYAASGLGILTKGPVGLLLPWISFILWELLKLFRGERAAKDHLWWGPLLALGIAAMWVIPACLAGGEEYARTILIKQHVGRAVDAVSHANPWHYYLINFPLDALPWFALLPVAIPEIRRLIRREQNKKLLLLFVVWCLTNFLFFSFISGKRERYLLPMFPVFSILLAHAVTSWTPNKVLLISLKTVGYLVLTTGILLLTFPLLSPFLKIFFSELEIFRLHILDWRLWLLFAFGVLAIVIASRALSLVDNRLHSSACFSLALSCLLLFSAIQVYYVPGIEPVKSARIASESILGLLPENGTVAFYFRRFDNGWNFYLDRSHIPIITNEDIQKKQPQFDIIILRANHFESLKKYLDMRSYENATSLPVGSKNFVLLKRTK